MQEVQHLDILSIKKRQQRRPAVAVASAVTLPTNALHIIDTASRTKYLVDTGACCSLYPASFQQRENIDPDPISLTAAGGQPIRTYGTTRKTLHIADQPYSWDFRIAAVTQPLLGADFLIHHRLVVDMAGRAVVPSASLRSPDPARSARIMGEISSCISGGSSGSSSVSSPYENLQKEYSDVFRPELRLMDSKVAKHDVVHHIETTGPPQHARFRRLGPQKLIAAKKAFSDMERMGVCKKASSPGHHHCIWFEKPTDPGDLAVTTAG